MSGTVLLIFEIIGTISFAISGAVTALQKKMDIFGVVILGLTTAVGGGVIRDLILGQTPPATFRNPLYALVAVATAVVVFFPAVRRLFGRHHRSYELVLLVMDSLGLGVFTVVGIRTAYALDGGQTATIVTGGELMNHVDYGGERKISDIIYFATAIPSGGK